MSNAPLCKLAASYFPTWYRSIIGAGELNFSVRNGLRWILTAITAFFFFLSFGLPFGIPPPVYLKRETLKLSIQDFLNSSLLSVFRPQLSDTVFFLFLMSLLSQCLFLFSGKVSPSEAFGLLVPLGFDIAAFTPAAYQRGSLPRPSMEISS